jgi:uncharacterized membrane protein
VSCGTLLRFDFRRRLMVGLLIGLFYAVIMGIGVLGMMSRISPWVWVFPLLVLYIVGTIFIVAHIDRIIEVEPRKDDSHGLPNDA